MILLTNGCSFTEAYTLPDRENNRWSAKVCKRLNYLDNNIALGGSSNSRIYRTTIEWFNSNEPPELVIIGWTGTDRDELPYHRGLYLRMTHGVCLPDVEMMDDDLDYVKNFWLKNLHNEYLLVRNLVHYILHLQQFFELHKIKYLFFQALGYNILKEFLEETDRALKFADMAWQWRDKKQNPPLKNCHPEYIEMVNLVKKIKFKNWVLENQYNMAKYLKNLDYRTDSTGHYVEDGHARWAEEILNHL